MADPDLKVSFESLPAIEQYIALPLSDPRRIELLSFLTDAEADRAK